MTYEDRITTAAKAEDTYDLLTHIAWTDTIRPELEKQVKRYHQLLVSEALGSPLPEGLTREKVAGICYGVQWISNFLEKVLQDGKKAVADLQEKGISLTKI